MGIVRWLVLLGVCACNQAFDLGATRLVDSPPAPVDVLPIDAPPPPACPAIGTVPKFSDDLRQLPPRECIAYSVSDNQMAMAQCAGVMRRGAADSDLPDQIMMDPELAYETPRLAPDGDHLFVSHVDSTTYATNFIELAVNGTTVQKVGSYAAPHEAMYGEWFDISTPSRGPDRHIVYSDYNNVNATTDLVEIADGSGAFHEVARYPLNDLGVDVTAFRAPSLSADGLRVVFLNSSYFVVNGLPPAQTNGAQLGGGGGYCGYANTVVMYADRATTSDHFNTAVAIETIPDQVDWPYMTPDCGRMYVSALNRVFYFKQ